MAQPSSALLASWLYAAYELEQAQLAPLTQLANHFEPYPPLKAEIRLHIEETKQQVKELAACLAALGEKPEGKESVIPAASLTGRLTAWAADNTQHDSPIKGLVLLHGLERFEYLCYMAIAEVAHTLGQDAIADTCERIALEEKTAAAWAEEQIPGAVSRCIANAGAAV